MRERYRRQGYDFTYGDESGFEPKAYRRYGYDRRGVKVQGLRSGRPRSNLLAAKGSSKLLVPWLFERSCNSTVFNQWL
ncbi:MAG: hypothetical protein AAGA67_08760 [Cyanobacteria bacterium P01_F01_bin.153]